MLLKLVMPDFDRAAERGSIAKWHKSEGEWVQYGDSLLDMRVTTVKFLKRSADARSILAQEPRPGGTYSVGGWDWLLRLTASDVGVLRRIHAREGSPWSVGELLAVLSTEASEPIDEGGVEWDRASRFRVVVNPVESE